VTLDFPAPAERLGAQPPDRREDNFGFAIDDTIALRHQADAAPPAEASAAVAATPIDIFDIAPARAAAPVVDTSDVFASYTPAIVPDELPEAVELPADTIDPLVAHLESWIAAIETARVELAAR
jgi:hypothetical protein